jgi:hypothetical protein
MDYVYMWIVTLQSQQECIWTSSMFLTFSATARLQFEVFQWLQPRHSHPYHSLMQVPEELSDPRRVVAAEQEDSSWRSMLPGLFYRLSVYKATEYDGSVMFVRANMAI